MEMACRNLEIRQERKVCLNSGAVAAVGTGSKSPFHFQSPLYYETLKAPDIFNIYTSGNVSFLNDLIFKK